MKMPTKSENFERVSTSLSGVCKIYILRSHTQSLHRWVRLGVDESGRLLHIKRQKVIIIACTSHFCIEECTVKLI